MSAAGFILAINIFVAGLFAVAFGIVALRDRTAIGARWLALGYGFGATNSILEFVLPLQHDPRVLAIILYAVSLGAFLVCIVGLAVHYKVRVPWIALAVLGLSAIVANAMLVDQASTASLERALIYQLPFFAAHLLGSLVVFSSRRRDPLDMLLIGLLLLTSLQFVAKPFMGPNYGNPGVQDYLHSVYGAYSQLMVAFLLIADGLLMVLIIVRDQMAALTVRSETDKLSGLLNRRGFQDHADRAIAATQRAHQSSALVVADLDHFKSINDSKGHDHGDLVIETFARLLADHALPGMVVGRQGGEEFAVLMPGADLGIARRYAEAVRVSFSDQAGALGLSSVSASFGVVQSRVDETLLDMLRRADVALYDAKKTGRNRVSTANHIEEVLPPNGVDRRQGGRRSSGLPDQLA